MDKTMDRASLLGFAAVAGLFGIFYALANFGKAFSAFCGGVQLIGAVILCVCIFIKKGWIPKLCGSIVLAIALCQVIALYNWVVWSPNVNFLWFYFDSGLLFPVLHVAFAVWGGILGVRTLSTQRSAAL